MDLFLDVLAESLVDTAKMLPFLFLAYLFIEYVETRHGERIEALLAGSRRWGFVPGALLGLCAPVRLFRHCLQLLRLPGGDAGHVDGGFPCHQRRSHPPAGVHARFWDKLVLLMVLKVLYAIAVGFGLDFVLRKALPKGLRAPPAVPMRWTATRNTTMRRATTSPSGKQPSATRWRSSS